VQTLFNKVNGAIANFNGMGRNAHNNNTIFCLHLDRVFNRLAAPSRGDDPEAEGADR
jgi:hypothetical protein